MSKAVDNLNNAFEHAMRCRPEIGGFPYLAEALRLAGITKNIWTLPSCQSIYHTQYGPVVSVLPSLVTKPEEIPPFNSDALIKALRRDQAGETTFPEFLKAAWDAGVIGYEVDFEARRVDYFGVFGEIYSESYPAVKL